MATPKDAQIAKRLTKGTYISAHHVNVAGMKGEILVNGYYALSQLADNQTKIPPPYDVGAGIHI